MQRPCVQKSRLKANTEETATYKQVPLVPHLYREFAALGCHSLFAVPLVPLTLACGPWRRGLHTEPEAKGH